MIDNTFITISGNIISWSRIEPTEDGKRYRQVIRLRQPLKRQVEKGKQIVLEDTHQDWQFALYAPTETDPRFILSLNYNTPRVARLKVKPRTKDDNIFIGLNLYEWL